MKFRKIGVWRKNNESGFYVEAIDMKGEYRFAAVNPSMLWEEQVRDLDKGEIVEIEELGMEDLYARIDHAL